MPSAAAEAVAHANFDGFRPAGLQFFRDLASNQSKPWFDANRAIYDSEVLGPLRALVVDLGAELARRGVPLTGDPRKAVFRIHRDVRFSRDKSPYKTNGGLVLSRDGGKGGFGLLYFHFDPNGCFAAAGFYQPEPKLLEALRAAMLEEPDRLLSAIAHLRDAGAELDFEDRLTRLPRGFEHAAESKVADLVRVRSLVGRKPIREEMVAGPALVAELADFAEAALPLLRFGWDAL